MDNAVVRSHVIRKMAQLSIDNQFTQALLCSITYDRLCNRSRYSDVAS